MLPAATVAEGGGLHEGGLAGLEFPELVGVGVDGGGDGGEPPEILGEEDGGDDDDGEEDEFGLDDAGEFCAGEFLGAECDDAAGVVVEGDGGEPDTDAAVAEGLRGDEGGFADHGDFDPLAGDAFHACGDVRNDRRVDEAVGEENPEGEVGDEPMGEDDVGGGGEEVDGEADPEGYVAAAGGRMEEASPVRSPES